MAWSCCRYKRKCTTLRRYCRNMAIFFTALLRDQHIAFLILSAPHFAIVSSMRSCWIPKSRFMLFPISFVFLLPGRPCIMDIIFCVFCFSKLQHRKAPWRNRTVFNGFADHRRALRYGAYDPGRNRTERLQLERLLS